MWFVPSLQTKHLRGLCNSCFARHLRGRSLASRQEEAHRMYGNTDVMRKHVSRLREQGTEIRSMADQLVSKAEAVTWEGRAGDAMRERIRVRATRLRDAAEQHDQAADSL